MLAGKKVLMGLTGSIAAYKAALVVRELKRLGAQVKVVMTEHGQHFITPLTMEILSQNRVITGLFPAGERREVEHVSLAQWPDRILICPATANIIGKIAHGIADDILSTIVIARGKDVILAPAMNARMYLNPVVQKNIAYLKDLGYGFIEPEVGELACGDEAVGRLADPRKIIDYLCWDLLATTKLAGKKILVTAGPTQEPLDPVRFFTNRSSGKMGFALAREASFRGDEVTLIAGRNNLPIPVGVNYRGVTTAAEMAAAVKKEFKKSDIVLMAAAVADFRPGVVAGQKIKKETSPTTLKFVRTEDILAHLGEVKNEKQILVGFAVETENEVGNAKKKLEGKNLDLIVVNNPLVEGAGFGEETNIVKLIDRSGKVEEYSKMSKQEVAKVIFEKLEKLPDRD